MSRIARIVVEGIPYHITQRGNGRQQVFFDDSDYALYCDLLRDAAAGAHLRLWGYCLMPNHVHIVAVPERPGAMARALGRTHADYARHFNFKKRACGHVWQARYFSCPLDPPRLWRAMAYVERNPVRAGLVELAGHYRWSSAAAHLGLRAPPDHLDMEAWRAEYTEDRWHEVLQSSTGEEAFGHRLQESGRRGRPLGSEEFVRNLETESGRTLRPRPAGRPSKNRQDLTGLNADQLALWTGV